MNFWFWLVYGISAVFNIIFVRMMYKTNNGGKSDWSPSITIGNLIFSVTPIFNTALACVFLIVILFIFLMVCYEDRVEKEPKKRISLDEIIKKILFIKD